MQYCIFCAVVIVKCAVIELYEAVSHIDMQFIFHNTYPINLADSRTTTPLTKYFFLVCSTRKWTDHTEYQQLPFWRYLRKPSNQRCRDLPTDQQHCRSNGLWQSDSCRYIDASWLQQQFPRPNFFRGLRVLPFEKCSPINGPKLM